MKSIDSVMRLFYKNVILVNITANFIDQINSNIYIQIYICSLLI